MKGMLSQVFFIPPSQILNSYEAEAQVSSIDMHIVILRVVFGMIRLSWFINFIVALKTGLEYPQCNYKNVLKLRRIKIWCKMSF